MEQLAQGDSRKERVPLGAFVDRDQHLQLVERARREDRSLSAIVRRALQAELKRDGENEQP
jgi:post-segregation antitoxin (ccd killing protein)